MRRFYAFLVRLHPKVFRERFGPEMLCAFEDGARTEGTVHFVGDVFLCLLRQWILRCGGGRPAALIAESAPPIFSSLSLADQSAMGRGPLFLGFLISLGLFAASGALIGGRAAHRNLVRPSLPSELDWAQTLTPSGLMGAAGHSAGTVPAFRIAGARTKLYELPYQSGRFAIGLVKYRWTDPPPGSVHFPLNLFYPALGNGSAAYSSQIEKLVSHGYIVACVEPPDVSPTMAFGDSRPILFVLGRGESWYVFNQLILLMTQDRHGAPDLQLRPVGGGVCRISLLMTGLNDQNFTGGPLAWSMSPRHRGSPGARAALPATNVHTCAFFEKYLKNESGPLWDSASGSRILYFRVRSCPGAKR